MWQEFTNTRERQAQVGETETLCIVATGDPSLGVYPSLSSKKENLLSSVSPYRHASCRILRPHH